METLRAAMDGYDLVVIKMIEPTPCPTEVQQWLSLKDEHTPVGRIDGSWHLPAGAWGSRCSLISSYTFISCSVPGSKYRSASAFRIRSNMNRQLQVDLLGFLWQVVIDEGDKSSAARPTLDHFSTSRYKIYVMQQSAEVRDLVMWLIPF